MTLKHFRHSAGAIIRHQATRHAWTSLCGVRLPRWAWWPDGRQRSGGPPDRSLSPEPSSRQACLGANIFRTGIEHEPMSDAVAASTEPLISVPLDRLVGHRSLTPELENCRAHPRTHSNWMWMNRERPSYVQHGGCGGP